MKKTTRKRLWILTWILLGIGLFVFIPDPLDFVFGLGELVEAIAGLAGSVLAAILIFNKIRNATRRKRR